MRNNSTPNTAQLVRNPLATLERLVPKVWMTLDEAKRIAELQACRLRELSNTTSPVFPQEIITDMSILEVDFDRGMPLTLSGTTFWSNRKWIILLNGLESENRQRFTMAHEFKHILDHNSKKYLYQDTFGSTADQKAERAADYFAGCLLMPKSHVRRLFYQGVQRPTELCVYFQVSPMAMQVRLLQLGLVDASERCDLQPYAGWHDYSRKRVTEGSIV